MNAFFLSTSFPLNLLSFLPAALSVKPYGSRSTRRGKGFCFPIFLLQVTQALREIHGGSLFSRNWWLSGQGGWAVPVLGVAEWEGRQVRVQSSTSHSCSDPPYWFPKQQAHLNQASTYWYYPPPPKLQTLVSCEEQDSLLVSFPDKTIISALCAKEHLILLGSELLLEVSSY